MDIKTILICLFAINLFMGLMTYGIKLTQKTFNGINFWIIANVFIALGYFLIAFRNIIPDLFSVILAQLFFIVAAFSRILGLDVFFGNGIKVQKKIVFGLITIVYAALISSFTFFQNNQFYRTILVGIFLSAISIYSGMLIIKNKPRKNDFNYYLTASTFFIFSFIFIVRIMGWILFPSARNMFSAVWINSVQFIASLMIDILWTTMFFIIHNQKLTHQIVESEAQKRAILNGISANIAFVDTDLKIVWTNEAAARSVHKTIDEMIGYHCFSLWADPTKPCNNCPTIKAMQTLKREHINITTPDGRIWDESGEPVFDEQGNLIGLVEIAQDITRSKKAQRALEESEEKFRTLVANLPGAVYRCAVSYPWEVEYISEAIFDITGYNASDFMNNNITYGMLIHPDDKANVSKIVDAAIESNSEYEIVYRLGNKDGTWHWILERGRANYSKERNTQWLDGVNFDITEQKNAENQLQKYAHDLQILNDDKDRFLSILAHDLKNPFGPLLGFLELLKNNIHTYDINKIETFVTNIDITANRIYNLLDELLVWASVQSGKIPFEPQKLHFHGVCKDTIQHLQSVADNKNIKLLFLPGYENYVLADHSMLKTVLRNLISNAIKFTPTYGKVTITTEIDQNMTVIIISDNGIGIEPDLLTKLFDITKIISTQGTAKEIGTGLGLLICKDFVENHGGKIWVESEVGKGSSFKFTLPRLVEQ